MGHEIGSDLFEAKDPPPFVQMREMNLQMVRQQHRWRDVLWEKEVQLESMEDDLKEAKLAHVAETTSLKGEMKSMEADLNNQMSLSLGMRMESGATEGGMARTLLGG